MAGILREKNGRRQHRPGPEQAPIDILSAQIPVGRIVEKQSFQDDDQNNFDDQHSADFEAE
jgi:hypothetical protein